jgi:hypothetical protein
MKTIQQLTKRVEKMEALDRFANFMQKFVSRIVPQESALKDLLSGT